MVRKCGTLVMASGSKKKYWGSPTGLVLKKVNVKPWSSCLTLTNARLFPAKYKIWMMLCHVQKTFLSMSMIIFNKFLKVSLCQTLHWRRQSKFTYNLFKILKVLCAFYIEIFLKALSNFWMTLMKLENIGKAWRTRSHKTQFLLKIWKKKKQHFSLW